MHRLTTRPTGDDFEGEERKAYDLLAGRWNITRQYGATGEPKPDPLMALSPVVGWAWMARTLAVGKCQGQPGSFTAYHHELATITASFHGGYNDFLGLHVPLALAAGVRPEALVAIREGRDGDLADDERAIVSFVRGVLDGTVDDAGFEAVRERIGTERGVLELTSLILNIFVRMRTTQVFGGGGLVSDARVDELLAAACDGTLPPGDLAKYEEIAFHPDRVLEVAP